MTVQLTMIWLFHSPDQSRYATAILPSAPPRMALSTCGLRKAAFTPWRCRTASRKSMLEDVSAASTSSRSTRVVVWAAASAGPLPSTRENTEDQNSGLRLRMGTDPENAAGELIRVRRAAQSSLQGAIHSTLRLPLVR